MHLLLRSCYHSQNIIYLPDKAMLTVCHRLLCTLSHLYYMCHCIVSCTCCPFLFTVNSQVTLHWSRPVEFRLCCFPLVISGCQFLHVASIPHFKYSSLLLIYASHFIGIFNMTRSDCNSSGNSDCTMPTAGNVCLLSGGVGPQSLLRRPQWLFHLMTA